MRIVLIEQTTVVDPERLGRSAGRLDAGELQSVDEALTLILAFWLALKHGWISNLLLPGIDKADTEILEVTHVACGESRLAGARNAGDLNVADLHGPAGALP
jgi:hypothetical protein